MLLLICLIAGVIGANIAGAVLKPFNLGLRANSLAGLAGGLVAMKLTPFLPRLAAGEAVPLLNALGAGALAGFVLTGTLGLLRRSAGG